MQVKYKGYMKICRFRPISRAISKMVQDTAIVTVEDKKEHVCDLSNGPTSNDLDSYSDP